MAKLRIYHPITDHEDKTVLSDWLGMDGICYTDIVDFFDKMDANDNKVDLLIHCPGGECLEGWAIYDKLRTSGKEISATVEGECSSMATILLLAAPLERRFGFENARICIHNPAVCAPDLGKPERLTADGLSEMQAKLAAQQASLMAEQKRILDLYVERTGTNREKLQALMNEDKYIDMKEAIGLHFIGSTVAPNTAIKTSSIKTTNIKAMDDNNNVTVASKLLDKVLRICGLQKIEDAALLHLDQKITSADGTVFTVEREDGDPQVGDRAYPNGTYTLDDGTVIVVANEVIETITPADENGKKGGKKSEKDDKDDKPVDTKDAPKDDANPVDDTKPVDTNDDTKPVDEPSPEPPVDDKDSQITDLTSQVDTLTQKVDKLKADKKSLNDENKELKAQVASLQADNDSLKANVESLKAENYTISKENESLKADKETLTKAQKSDDETAILDVVNKAGGKEWLDAVCAMKSTFHPNNRHFEPRGEHNGQMMSRTQQLLAQAREKNEAKRNKK